MTEAEWLAGSEPDNLLEFLREQASDRQFRLFMCACCRRFLPLLPRKPAHDLRLCEKYVAYGEQLAEGSIAWEELETVFDEMELANVSHDGYQAAVAARQATYKVVAGCSRSMFCGPDQIAHPASCASGYSRTVMSRLQGKNKIARGSRPTARKMVATMIAEKRYQIRLLHDLFGNPFRRISVDRSWFTPTVTGLAEAIYADRAFDRMPILGDALEEAGCTDEAILSHCRGPGPHVRGCWVVDLLLGKE